MNRTEPGNALADFDAHWYTAKFPDVAQGELSPEEHYLRIGRRLGRPGSARSASSLSQAAVLADATKRPDSGFVAFGRIDHRPLISILIVGFKSARDLEALFPTIAAQTYRNFEVILVENSDEDTEPLLRQHFEHCRFVRADNVGFAEGNNLAFRESRGELIALINPDTRLAPDMLQQLLDALRIDEQAACVVPKINFFERFVSVQIEADGPFAIGREALLARLSYRKIFVRHGFDRGDHIHSAPDGLLTFDLPYEGERELELVLAGDAEADLSTCHVRIGNGRRHSFVQAGSPSLPIRLRFDSDCGSDARYLVNNAGSGLHPDGSPYDRGFAEVDDGIFFSKAYVPALCGCAALIRRIAILDRDLFCAPFFAYYEDSELSHWLMQSGYRILYQPAAVIYHRHSESTDENSLTWQVLVGRSRTLYNLATTADALPLRFFSFDYPDEFTGPLRARLGAFDDKIKLCENFDQVRAHKRPTVCIYNTYWSSMGGGEKHALDFCRLFEGKYDVYLASENDFELAELGKYFANGMSFLRKIVCNKIDTHFTSKFDIFVNSTFLSTLIPSADHNFYIVSFPQMEISADLLKRYVFMHNSNFTAGWADEYWGEHERHVVLPILGAYPAITRQILRDHKRRTILSVGRFNYGGHGKNHHQIVRAFKSILAENPQLSDWTLKIVGSVSLDEPQSLRYLADLEEVSKGAPIEIYPNASRDLLDSVYAEAAIYVHAAGLGIPENQPERHEHFGITVFEAMANGCLPVVYALGGPAEQTRGLDQGLIFHDKRELQEALSTACAMFDDDAIDIAAIQSHALRMHDYNRASAGDALKDVVKDSSNY